MIRKLLIKMLEEEYNVEITIFYDKTLQALQKTKNNYYIIITPVCKNVFKLKKKLKEELERR